MIVVDTFHIIDGHIAMAFTHDIGMRIVPGTSLGDFTLGDSLWNVLERMRARKLEYEGTTVQWDREVSVSLPLQRVLA